MRVEHRDTGPETYKYVKNRHYTDPEFVNKTQGHCYRQRNTLRVRQEHRHIYSDIQ